MTISSTTRKAGPFDGNGVTTSFPFTFKVFAAADLRVVRTTPSGVESDLTLNSDYSVTLNGDQDANPGGTVTYPISGSPLPAGWRLTLIGDIDYLQPTDITNGGGFYPQVIENALDRNVMLIQQVAEEAGRSIRVAVSDDTTSGLELPAQASRADKVLGFDANGDFRVYDTNVSVRATGLEVFTATGGQTVFTTPFTYVPNANALLVFQNGAVLTPGVDFTETSGTEFTLTVGATGGDTVVALAGLDVTGGVQGDQIVDGTVTAAKLASTLNLSSKTLTLPTGAAAANLGAGEVTATMLAGALDLTGKTITVATATGTDSDTSVASTAMVQAAITARTATESAAGILEIATAAELAAASSTALAVTPGVVRRSPYALKAWAFIDTTTPASPVVSFGVGVSSASRTASGIYDVNFSDTYASSGGKPVLVPFAISFNPGTETNDAKVQAISTTSVTFRFEDSASNDDDPAQGFFVMAAGTLA